MNYFLDDILSLMFDESSSADTRTLTGHSGPIFGVSFSPDKNFLVSGSEDGTGSSTSLDLLKKKDFLLINHRL